MPSRSSRSAELIAGDEKRGRGLRVLRAIYVVLVVVFVAATAYTAALLLREYIETNRTTARFDPPVLAGQLVPGPCANGGFHARFRDTIVVTMAAHCSIAIPGTPMRDADGRLVGIFGRAAEFADCAADRRCAPSDLVWLALAPDRIPWGHLNLVDMGAGGYRTITPETSPLTCADMHVGDPVEVIGREHFRSGKLLAVGPYEYAEDVNYPCMVITDVAGFHGDSGGPALVNGLPAGTTARVISGYVAFTPLPDALANLGLELCTEPNCGLSP